MASCPACKRCPFVNGVCEDRANRGRRFFLMGALALPVARQIEVVAAKVVYEPPTLIELPPVFERYYGPFYTDGKVFDCFMVAG